MTITHDAVMGHGYPSQHPRIPGMGPSPPQPHYCHLIVITGDLLKLVHLRTYPRPTVLTSSGGHRNMYSWLAGGTHPAGMLFCLFSLVPIFCTKIKKGAIQTDLLEAPND